MTKVLKIMSISLGSDTRDHESTIEFMGNEINLSRKGTNGSLEEALQLYRDYDGKVDAFGVGGTMLYLLIRDKRYYLRGSKKIIENVKLSKLGDGNRVKGILEQNTIDGLEKMGYSLKNKTVFHACASDRWSLAEQISKKECNNIFGDLALSLGIPLFPRSLKTVYRLSRVMIPIISQMPVKWLYPSGMTQEKEPVEKYKDLFAKADVIAGDFHYVKKHLPKNLENKVIITNTTTAKNLEMLKSRGLHILATSTPRIDGRTYGTNVMEAMMIASISKPQDEINEDDISEIIRKSNIRPEIEILNP